MKGGGLIRARCKGVGMHRNAWPIDLALLIIAIVDSNDKVVVQVPLYSVHCLCIRDIVDILAKIDQEVAASRCDRKVDTDCGTPRSPMIPH